MGCAESKTNLLETKNGDELVFKDAWRGSLANLFDDEILIKENLEAPRVYPSSRSESNTEEDEMADGMLVLSIQDPETVVELTQTRLSQDLAAHSTLIDPFESLIAHRLEIVGQMHEAIAHATNSVARTSLSINSTNLSNDKNSRILSSIHEKKQLPPALQLALKLLYSLLDFVRDDYCEPQQKSDFLQQVSPLLSHLPPLCLSSSLSKITSTKNQLNDGKMTHGRMNPRSSASDETVLDSLRDFLYLASLPTKLINSENKKTQKKYTNNGVHEAKEETLTNLSMSNQISIEQRSVAATSLLSLASARGRASDLLLAVKVLLGIGMTRPNRYGPKMGSATPYKATTTTPMSSSSTCVKASDEMLSDLVVVNPKSTMVLNEKKMQKTNVVLPVDTSSSLKRKMSKADMVKFNKLEVTSSSSSSKIGDSSKLDSMLIVDGDELEKNKKMVIRESSPVASAPNKINGRGSPPIPSSLSSSSATSSSLVTTKQNNARMHRYSNKNNKNNVVSSDAMTPEMMNLGTLIQPNESSSISVDNVLPIVVDNSSSSSSTAANEPNSSITNTSFLWGKNPKSTNDKRSFSDKFRSKSGLHTPKKSNPMNHSNVVHPSSSSSTTETVEVVLQEQVQMVGDYQVDSDIYYGGYEQDVKEEESEEEDNHWSIMTKLTAPAALSALKQLSEVTPIIQQSDSSEHISSQTSEPTVTSFRKNGHKNTKTSQPDGSWEVFTCGQNTYGELGYNDISLKKELQLVEGLGEGNEPICIAAGNEHTVILTKKGQVFTCGYNDNGQCGQHNSIKSVNGLKLIPNFDNVKHVYAFNGCEHTMFVMNDGTAYACGYNYKGQLGHGGTSSEPIPMPVRGLEGRIVVNVSCSYYHSILSCMDGAVFSVGRNDFGQLGHGDTSDRKTPRLVDSLRGVRTTGLACGQYHTCVATTEGHVLTCGKNDYGQLGIDSSESQKLLVIVPLGNRQGCVVDVRCGYYHTLILCDSKPHSSLPSSGSQLPPISSSSTTSSSSASATTTSSTKSSNKLVHVLGWGRNDYGQLGLGHAMQRVFGPQLVSGLEGQGCFMLAAGCYHSVVAAANGNIFVFGRNNHGQLGIGNNDEQHKPYLITQFQGKHIAMIAAGFYHTIILTGDDRKRGGGNVGDMNRAGGKGDNTCTDSQSQSSNDDVDTMGTFSPEFLLSLPNLQLSNTNEEDRQSLSVPINNRVDLSVPLTTSTNPISMKSLDDDGDTDISRPASLNSSGNENETDLIQRDDISNYASNDFGASPEEDCRSEPGSNATSPTITTSALSIDRALPPSLLGPSAAVGNISPRRMTSSLDSPPGTGPAAIPVTGNESMDDVNNNNSEEDEENFQDEDHDDAEGERVEDGGLDSMNDVQSVPKSLNELRQTALKDKHQKLLDGDGSAPPERTALFILTHMARLAPVLNDSLLSPSKSQVPSHSHPTSGEHQVDQHLYCIDVRVETFESLLAVLVFLHQPPVKSLDGALDSGSEQCFVDLYHPSMILSCLRILTANLNALLNSFEVEELLKNVRHEGEEDHDDVIDINDDDEGKKYGEEMSKSKNFSSRKKRNRNGKTCPENDCTPKVNQDLLGSALRFTSHERQNILLGLPERILPSQETNHKKEGSETDVIQRRYQQVLKGLRRQLLLFVVDPPLNGAVELVQAASAKLLILAVELFYPTQQAQATLLEGLLVAPQSSISHIAGADVTLQDGRDEDNNERGGALSDGINQTAASKSQHQEQQPRRRTRSVFKMFARHPVEHSSKKTATPTTVESPTIPSIIANTPSLSDDDDDDASVEHYVQSDVFKHGFSAARRFLLGPLLRRLGDDNLVMMLIPQPSSSTTQASPSILLRMLSLLAQKAASYHKTNKHHGILSSASDDDDDDEEEYDDDDASLQNKDEHEIWNQEHQKEENRFLIQNLLLTVQKHVLSWAAQEMFMISNDDDKEEKEKRHDKDSQKLFSSFKRQRGVIGTTYKENSNIYDSVDENAPSLKCSSSIIEKSLRRKQVADMTTCNGSAVKCLVDYALNILTLAYELSLKMNDHHHQGGIGNIRSHRNSANSQNELLGGTYESTVNHRNHTMSNETDDTFLYQIVPSLITGLLPFAHCVSVANSLLDITDKLIRSLDFNADLFLLTADLNYVAFRNGIPESSTLPNTPIPVNSGIVGGIQTSVASKDNMRLPKDLLFLKSLAVLAGKFASTLTSPCSENTLPSSSFSSSCEVMKSSPTDDTIRTTWLASSLFQHGVNEHHIERFKQVRMFPVPFDDDKDDDEEDIYSSTSVITQTSHSIVQSWLESKWKENKQNIMTLDQDINDKNSKIFSLVCDWLKNSYSQLDGAYRMSSIQAKRSDVFDEITQLEQTCLKCLLLHTNEFESALMSFIGDSKPSLRLLALYRVVAETSTWLWRLRSQLRSEDKGKPDVLFAYQTAIDAVELITCFKSGPSIGLLHVPSSPTITPNTTSPSPPSIVHRRWRSALIYVRAAVRWRRLVKDSRSKPITLSSAIGLVPFEAREIFKFVKAAVESSSCFSSDTAAPNNGVEGSSNMMQVLADAIVVAHERAAYKCRGLLTYQRLCSTLRLRSLVFDLLTPLCDQMEAFSLKKKKKNIPLNFGLTNDTGIVPSSSSSCSSSFQPDIDLMNDTLPFYLENLEGIGHEEGGAKGIIRQHFCEFLKHVLTSMVQSVPHDDARNIDGSLYLLYCRIWGVHFSEQDWSFLVQSDLFSSLHDIIYKFDHLPEVSTPTVNHQQPQKQASRSVRGVGGGGDKGNLSNASLSSSASAASSVSAASTVSAPSNPSLHAQAMQRHHECLVVQCCSATRCLLRLLVSRFTQLGLITNDHLSVKVGGWYDVLSPIFEVLRQDLVSGVAMMKPNTHSLVDSSNNNSVNSPLLDGNRSGHRRRCQEIITTPRRFMHMEDGLMIPADELLVNSKSSDFSITFWIYLTQESTGKPRSVLTRGSKHERWPILILREQDRRLEVSFGISSMDTLCERLTSKDPIPLHKWTHIGLVSEANKLRLFLNGTLDTPRNNCGVPHRNHRHPLYIGKVPDGAVRLDGIRGGFEGSMAHLRYYTRALSPIHVRIVCDQGPPTPCEIMDKICYQSISSLIPLASTQYGKQHLSSKHWLDLLFKIIIGGTSRMQQASLRLISIVSPNCFQPLSLTPLHMMEKSLLMPLDCQKSENKEEFLGPQTTKSTIEEEWSLDSQGQLSFSSYLLELVGLSQWRTIPVSDLTISSTLSSNNVSVVGNSALPYNLRFWCEGLSQNEIDQQNAKEPHYPQHDLKENGGCLPLEALTDISQLSSEGIVLLANMLDHKTWSKSTSEAMRSSLDSLLFTLPKYVQSSQDIGELSDDMIYGGMNQLKGLAALSVLGGHSHELRVGGEVAVAQSDATATVVSLDIASNVAHVVINGESHRSPPSMCSNMSSTSSSLSSTNTINMNASSSFASTGKHKVLPLKTLRVGLDEITSIGKPNVHYGIEIRNLVSGSVMPVIEALLDQSSTTKYNTSSLFHAQCLAKSTKLLSNMLTPKQYNIALNSNQEEKNDDEASSREEDGDGFLMSIRALLDRPQLVRRLLSLAAQVDPSGDESNGGGGGRFINLAEAEATAVALRRRLYQIHRYGKTDPLGLKQVFTSHRVVIATTKEEENETSPKANSSTPSSPSGNGLNSSAAQRIREAQQHAHREENKLIHELISLGFPEEWSGLALRRNSYDVASASSWIVDNLDTLTAMTSAQFEKADKEEEGIGNVAVASSSNEDEDEANQDAENAEMMKRIEAEVIEYERNEARRRGLHQANAAAEEEEEENEDIALMRDCEAEQRQVEENEEEMLNRLVGQEVAQHLEAIEADVERRKQQRNQAEEEDEEDEAEEEEDDDDDEDDVMGEEKDGYAFSGQKMRALLNVHDRFEEQLAATVYDENYFPADPGDLPGSTYHGASGFGFGMSNSLTAGGDGHGVAGRSAKTVAAEVAGYDLNQLLQASLQAEITLAILYARVTMTLLMQYWPEVEQIEGDNHVHSGIGVVPSDVFSPLALVQFARLVVLRGPQIPLPQLTQPSAVEILNLKPSTHSPNLTRKSRGFSFVPLSVGASPLTSTSVMRSVFRQLILKENESMQYAKENHRSDEHLLDILSMSFLTAALDDLEAAALIEIFSDTTWTQRNLAVSDSHAALQPNVELSWWYLDLLLSTEAPCVYSGTTFYRLSQCLRSANMPIREICMRALTRIVVKWCDVLGTRYFSPKELSTPPITSTLYPKISCDIMKSERMSMLPATCASSSTNSVSVSRRQNNNGIVDVVETPQVMKELMSKSFPPLSKLYSSISRRVWKEKKEERVGFSAYAHACLDLIVAADELEKLIALTFSFEHVENSNCDEEEEEEEEIKDNTADVENDNVEEIKTDNDMFSQVTHHIDNETVSIMDKQESIPPLSSETKTTKTKRIPQKVVKMKPSISSILKSAPSIRLVDVTESTMSLSWTVVAALSSRFELEMRHQLPASKMMGPWKRVFRGVSNYYTCHHLYPGRKYSFRLRMLSPLSIESSNTSSDSQISYSRSLLQTTANDINDIKEGEFGPETTYETLHGSSFKFDRNKAGAAIFVSGNGLQATYGANESWKTMIGSVPFSCGRNHWEIRIDSSTTAYLFIGVATRKADLASFLGGDGEGWGYIGDRALYHKRTKVKVYGERFGEGDIVGVTLDLDLGTLSFSKNGVGLGVAFDGLGESELFPAVAFYNQGQQVSLIPTAFSCDGGGAVIGDSTAATSIADSIELANLMGSMHARTTLPLPLQREIYQDHIKWTRNSIIRYMTKGGFELNFDNSHETFMRCAKEYQTRFNKQLNKKNKDQDVNDDDDEEEDGVDGEKDNDVTTHDKRLTFPLFSAWDRISTPRGTATVVGCRDQQIWFHVDDEPGAWFFSDLAIEEGRKVGYFDVEGGGKEDDGSVMIVSRNNFTQPTNKTEEEEESKVESNQWESKEAELSDIAITPSATTCDDAFGKSRNTINTTVSGPSSKHMSFIGNAFERFSHLIESTIWSIEADAILVAALDKFSSTPKSSFSSTDGSQVNGPSGDLLNSSFNVPPPEAAQLAIDIEPHLRKLGGNFEKMTSRVIQSSVVARFSVLRKFNEMVMKVLPLIGLEDALQLSCRPARQASLWGEASRELGLAVMPSSIDDDEDDLSIEKGTPTEYSLAAGKGLGPLLCALRASVFSASKKTAMKLIMSRTATKASRAEDDYDYPPDLPQVMLNRPKAAAGKERRDPETRLSLSLFGQLFDELHFLDPSVLRLGYTHPMDDGQERCFKLKFEGEGVDDYGGPYREIFSQLATEVQAVDEMLKVESRTNRREATQCILPLLRPSPNSQFDDAKGNDKVIVQPLLAESRHLYLEMFHFLGQVIGMAMRSKVTIKLNVPSVFWKALVGEALVAEDLGEFDEATNAIVEHIQHLALSNPNKSLSSSSSIEEDADDELTTVLSELNWSTSMSGGIPISLFTCNGDKLGVKKQDALLWTKALTWQRLHESDTAYFAIRDGFTSVIPPAILPLLKGSELEELVCGKAEIDLTLLANNTEYDDDVLPDGEMVKRFWRVLESFNHDDRASFLRFVWARARLPNAEDFVQKFKLQSSVGDGPKSNPDMWLPKAHTCFFSLNLPNYSSDEIMAKQLRYAMENCIEMDADFKLAENEMTGWDEADEKDPDL